MESDIWMWWSPNNSGVIRGHERSILIAEIIAADDPWFQRPLGEMGRYGSRPYHCADLDRWYCEPHASSAAKRMSQMRVWFWDFLRKMPKTTCVIFFGQNVWKTLSSYPVYLSRIFCLYFHLCRHKAKCWRYQTLLRLSDQIVNGYIHFTEQIIILFFKIRRCRAQEP